MSRKKVVVAGAMGLIGRAVVSEYSKCESTEVIGLSRRQPDDIASQANCQYRSVDLSSKADSAQALADLTDVTHLVFTAWSPGTAMTHAEGARQIDANAAMFQNVLDALVTASHQLQHVTLMQGSKAYGMHFGPIYEPAREDDLRTMPPNFYYDQEDYLREQSSRADWGWTILRPATVFGFATASPINVITALGVYASISRHLGLPLRFPGPDSSMKLLRNAVDAELIAEGARWAGEAEQARGQIFNIVNGDTYKWQRVWPQVAQLFGMETAPSQSLPLVDVMSCQGPVWAEMMAANGLRFPYRELVDSSWPTAEVHFKREHDGILNPLKLRKFGFDGFRDTQESIITYLERMMEEKVIPDYRK